MKLIIRDDYGCEKELKFTNFLFSMFNVDCWQGFFMYLIGGLFFGFFFMGMIWVICLFLFWLCSTSFAFLVYILIAVGAYKIGRFIMDCCL